MAVGPRAFDAEQVGGVLGGEAAPDDGTEAIDDLRAKRERLARVFIADVLAFAPGLVEQEGGLVGAVGDDFDLEGHRQVLWEQIARYELLGVKNL